MARQPRFFAPGIPLLVIQRGNNREKLFCQITDYQAYRALFHHHLSEETLMAIREATNKAWVPGSTKFKERLSKKIERRVSLLPRGRPSEGKDSEIQDHSSWNLPIKD